MKAFWVFLLGSILALILTWPFPAKLERYYSDFGDYAFNGSVLWYNFDSLKSGRIFNQEKYFAGFQFFPYPYSLAYSDHLFVPSLIFSPVYLFTRNLVLSVNILTFLSFVLSFASAFYTVNFFLKKFWAGVLGGLVFAFNPLTFSHFYGDHTQLLYKFFLPLVFLYAYKFFDSPGVKSAFLFFFFFTLNALSVSYFQAFSLIILPIAIIPPLLMNFRVPTSDVGSHLRKILRYGLVAFVFLPILLYFNLPYLEFSRREMVSRPLIENGFFSARLLDWFTPAPQSLLYGDVYKKMEPGRLPRDETGRFYGAEHTLFPNIIPLVLASLSIIFFKRALPAEKKVFWYFFTILTSSFILSFGPYFGGWNSQEGNLPLPYLYLYQWLPFLKGIRVPARLEFLFYVPFSFFAAYGLKILLQKFRRRWLVIPAIFFLLIAENLHPFPFSSTSPTMEKFASGEYPKEALLFLEGKKTFHLPVNLENLAGEVSYLNFATHTGERTVNGYSGYSPPDQIKLAVGLDQDLDLEKMKALGLDFLVIHPQKVKPEDAKRYQELKEKHKPSIVYESGQLLILDLKTAASAVEACPEGIEPKTEFGLAQQDSSGPTFWVLNIENNRSCYLTRLFKSRYQTLTAYPGFIKKEIQYRHPAILSPGERVTLTEIKGEMKVR